MATTAHKRVAVSSYQLPTVTARLRHYADLLTRVAWDFRDRGFTVIADDLDNDALNYLMRLALVECEPISRPKKGM